jgi:RNA polymerase sigma-70 factor (ECF subfamily)
VSEEQSWIQQSLAGDAAAFGRLVEAYQGSVYNLACRMLGNSLEAEDAAQEAFLRAFTKLRTYRSERKFSTWLLSITSHYCIDRLRRRRFTWLSLEEPLPPARLQSELGLPEEAALRGETRAEVGRLLDGLEPAYRAPIVLRYWYDLSYDEIADTLGITLGAVKSRLHRARLKMAKQAAERQKARPVPREMLETLTSSTSSTARQWVQSSGRSSEHMCLTLEPSVP